MRKKTKKALYALGMAGVLGIGALGVAYANPEIIIDGVEYIDLNLFHNDHDATPDGDRPNAAINDHGALIDGDGDTDVENAGTDWDGHVIAEPHDPTEKQSLTVDLAVFADEDPKRLELNADKDVFFNCPNINPGDTMSAVVELANPSDLEAIEFSIWDVINLLPEDEKACKLLEQLQITISLDGSLFYDGSYSTITTPIMPWVNIPPTEKVTMDIEVYFPIECDNYYQNSRVFTKWVFLARGDIPSNVDTGDRVNPVLYGAGTALLVLVVGGFVVLMRARRRSEQTEDRQQH